MPVLMDGGGKALPDFITDGNPTKNACHEKGDHKNNHYRNKNDRDGQQDKGDRCHDERQKTEAARHQRLRNDCMRHPVGMRCQEEHDQHGQNSQAERLSKSV